ncbi:hypothetical protein K1X76_00735 [bacterium]|nr:hypothetical protein [bacterium]
MKKIKILIVLMFMSGALNNCNCGGGDFSLTDTDASRVNIAGLTTHNIVLDTITQNEEMYSSNVDFYLFKADTSEFIGCMGTRSFPALDNIPLDTMLTHVNGVFVSDGETVSLTGTDEIEIREVIFSNNLDPDRCPNVGAEATNENNTAVTLTLNEMYSGDPINVGHFTLRFRTEEAADYEPVVPHEEDGSFLKLAWAELAIFSYDTDEFSNADSTLLIVPYKKTDVIGCVEFPAFELGGYRMDELALGVTDDSFDAFNMDILDDDTDYQILFVDRDTGGCGNLETLTYKVFDRTGPLSKADLTADSILFTQKHRLEVQFYLAN